MVALAQLNHIVSADDNKDDHDDRQSLTTGVPISSTEVHMA